MWRKVRALLNGGGLVLLKLGSLARTITSWLRREAQPSLVWKCQPIRSAIFLNDGRLVIAHDRETVFYPFPDQQPTQMLPDGGYVAGDPTGRLIGIGKQGWVNLYRIDTGALIGSLNCWPSGEHIYPMELHFSPNGFTLAVAEKHHSRGPEVQLWDVVHRQQIGTIRIVDPDSTVIKALAFHPDGQHLIVSSLWHGLWLVDIHRQAVIRKIQDWPSGHLAFSPDGSQLVLGLGKSVRAYDTTTWWIVYEYTLAGTEPRLPERRLDKMFSQAVALSPDGRWLVMPTRLPSYDTFSLFSPNPPHTTLAIRRLADSKRARLLGGHAGRVTHLLFSPDNQWLVSVGIQEVWAWRVV
ncbi:MAG: WD40 repeat domain-containing protein [Chloroflexi bacterium]|nr:MAG: WD40 repeat domain-containing protein [Chloroflexota bacterium]